MGLKSGLVSALAFSCAAWSISAEFADDFNIPKGWRMQDRFHGFRYEALVEPECEMFAEAAQAAADDLACFGWVQRTSANTIAGEARCSKATGPLMQDRLRQGPGSVCRVRNLEVKDYPDTKIKLHFSHFKILDEERGTCFRDPPHQCQEFSTNASKPDPSCEARGCDAGASASAGSTGAAASNGATLDP